MSNKISNDNSSQSVLVIDESVDNETLINDLAGMEYDTFISTVENTLDNFSAGQLKFQYAIGLMVLSLRQRYDDDGLFGQEVTKLRSEVNARTLTSYERNQTFNDWATLISRWSVADFIKYRPTKLIIVGDHPALKAKLLANATAKELTDYKRLITNGYINAQGYRTDIDEHGRPKPRNAHWVPLPANWTPPKQDSQHVAEIDPSLDGPGAEEIHDAQPESVVVDNTSQEILTSTPKTERKKKPEMVSKDSYNAVLKSLQEQEQLNETQHKEIEDMKYENTKLVTDNGYLVKDNRSFVEKNDELIAEIRELTAWIKTRKKEEAKDDDGPVPGFDFEDDKPKLEIVT